MMIVRCPACLTIFRMRPDHLRAHGGMVRCGHCYSAFNALDHLLEEKRREPEPTLDSTPEPTFVPTPESPEKAADAARPAPADPLQREQGSFFILEERETGPGQPDTAHENDAARPVPSDAEGVGEDESRMTNDATPEFILDFDIPDSFLPSREPPERPDLEKRIRTSLPYPNLTEPETEASWTTRSTPEAPSPPPDTAAETGATPKPEYTPEYPSARFPDWEPDNPTVLDFEERTPEAFQERLEALDRRKSFRSEPADPDEPTLEDEPLTEPPEPDPITKEVPARAHDDPISTGPIIPHDDAERRDTIFGPDDTEADEAERAAEPPLGAGWGSPVSDVPAAHAHALESTPQPAARVLHHPAEAPADRPWLRAVGIGILLGMLMVQGGYLFRESITRAWPELRPAYLAICEHFGCTVPLPRVAGAITIEGSDLESGAAAGGLFVLHARIGNRAHHPQAFPHVELTLTDARDRPVVRRALAPEEWLPADTDVEDGFPSGKTLDLRIPFAAPEVRNAVGYRVYAFFP